MIRLSEAMARMSCSDEVQIKHVQEAFRLLNKSIIRVETPDIDFDEKPAMPIGADNGDEGEHPLTKGINGTNETNGVDSEEIPEGVKVKVRVSYEQYKSIANLLIIYLRQLEGADEGK